MQLRIHQLLRVSLPHEVVNYPHTPPLEVNEVSRLGVLRQEGSPQERRVGRTSCGRTYRVDIP